MKRRPKASAFTRQKLDQYELQELIVKHPARGAEVLTALLEHLNLRVMVTVSGHGEISAFDIEKEPR